MFGVFDADHQNARGFIYIEEAIRRHNHIGTWLVSGTGTESMGSYSYECIPSPVTLHKVERMQRQPSKALRRDCLSVKTLQHNVTMKMNRILKMKYQLFLHPTFNFKFKAEASRT